MARNYSLTAGFREGAAAGARHGRNPLIGLPLAAGAAVGGAALAALALAGTAGTVGLMFAAFFSMMSYNPLNIILLTALVVGTAYATSLAFRGSAHLLGMAKGALFDDVPVARADKVAPQPAPAAAPAPEISVPKYAGPPRANFFNLYAAPSAPAEAGSPVQPRRTAPKVN